MRTHCVYGLPGCDYASKHRLRSTTFRPFLRAESLRPKNAPRSFTKRFSDSPCDSDAARISKVNGGTRMSHESIRGAEHASPSTPTDRTTGASPALSAATRSDVIACVNLWGASLYPQLLLGLENSVVVERCRETSRPYVGSDVEDGCPSVSRYVPVMREDILSPNGQS